MAKAKAKKNASYHNTKLFENGTNKQTASTMRGKKMNRKCDCEKETLERDPKNKEKRRKFYMNSYLVPQRRNE